MRFNLSVVAPYAQFRDDHGMQALVMLNCIQNCSQISILQPGMPKQAVRGSAPGEEAMRKARSTTAVYMMRAMPQTKKLSREPRESREQTACCLMEDDRGAELGMWFRLESCWTVSSYSN